MMASDVEGGIMAQAKPDPAAGPTAITVNSAQVAAAKLQITLDRKLGRETPAIGKVIAAAK